MHRSNTLHTIGKIDEASIHLYDETEKYSTFDKEQFNSFNVVKFIFNGIPMDDDDKYRWTETFGN